MPFYSRSIERLHGNHGNPDHFEFAGDPLFGSPAEAVEATIRFDTNKADGSESAEELCLRQSTGNSTSPQVDVFSDPLGQFVTDDDVCELQAPAGP